MRMGDQLGSLTTSIYFNMRIGVIRVKSGNCQTIQIFENIEIQKNKKIGIFFNNYTRNSPDPFSLGWSHQPGLKGPPAPTHDPDHVEDL
jgi:hypothetical protein